MNSRAGDILGRVPFLVHVFLRSAGGLINFEENTTSIVIGKLLARINSSAR